MNTYFIILCGGSGKRLWPISQKNRPKQLVPFIQNRSLLEDTIDRIELIAHDKNNIGIITTKEQSNLISHNIKNKIGFMYEEPIGRNTGPAILYSALEMGKKDPNSVIAILPADAFIPDKKRFCSYLPKAIDYAFRNDKIVTLGLIPTYPATGYGYIQAKSCTQEISPVKKFHEKPNKKQALEYVDQGDMFWNLCMFIGKTHKFISEYKKHVPEMFDRVHEYFTTGKNYNRAPNISIDYAIMEKSEDIAVIPADFEWSDVGNLDTFLSIQQKHEKERTKIINIDSKNNIAKTTSKKIVTFVGVNNLCVIEEDNTLVIAKRDEVEKIKLVHDRLQEKDLDVRMTKKS
jgi:mannose-1-phosphate guanylyltransferase/mannose-6-phosphate isomerase